MPALPSPPDVLVLLALRLTGLVEVDGIARRTDLGEAEIATVLDAAADAGWARYREGRLHGWALTPAGRRHGEALLAAELDESGLRTSVRDAYERFSSLNPELLTLCTDWQLRDVGGQRAINDHTDPGYDERCIDRLEELHGKVEPVLHDLAGTFERFAPYGARLDTALGRVKGGDPENDWFTSPSVESYHTVWFELHEHLLATLGVERATEPSTQSAGSG